MQYPVLDTAFRVVGDDNIEAGDLRTADRAVDAAGGDELQQATVGLLCQRVVAAQGRLDIGVDQQDLLACVGEKSGQIGGEGGFLHTALG
jgi:hypothetical protein